MTYQYKMVPVSENLSSKQGKDLGESLAQYVEELVNKMAKDGWEFYRTDNYTVHGLVGCLGAIFGQKGEKASYNLLVFRKNI